MGAIRVHEFISLDGIIDAADLDHGLRVRPRDALASDVLRLVSDGVAAAVVDGSL